MWQVDSGQVDDVTHRWSVSGAAPGRLSFRQVCSDWQVNAAFRAFWIAGLKALPLDAYCWECPPVTAASLSRDFECVFVASPSLARMTPDREAFEEHFRPGCHAVTFGNLGGDAVLVAPCPAHDARDFRHLGEFVRTAPAVKQDALWQAVGEAMLVRVGDNPVWLSTAGHGIAWLHVRLDSEPKYYRYRPYVSR